MFLSLLFFYILIQLHIVFFKLPMYSSTIFSFLSFLYFAFIPGDGSVIEGSGSSGGEGVFKLVGLLRAFFFFHLH